MSENQKRPSIRYWAEDERPREKMLLKGRHVLSNAELIAILIGSGNAEESAVDLSRRILASVSDNLVELSRLQINDFKKFKGIGEAKAISIIAALELGARRRQAEALEKPQIRSSKDIFELMQDVMTSKQHEEFWIILLNRSNKILRRICVSEGGMTGTVADPKKIFRLALENFAASLIVCHNHPSGNIKPSEQDIKLTQKLREAGKLLEIELLDHLIFGDEKYFSFADSGMI